MVLLNSSQNRRRVGTHNFLNLLSVLEQQKGRHGADAQLLGYIGAVIDIELDKADVAKLVAELLDLGRNGLARAAPLGKGVDDDELRRLDDFGVEFGFSEILSVRIQLDFQRQKRKNLTP